MHQASSWCATSQPSQRRWLAVFAVIGVIFIRASCARESNIFEPWLTGATFLLLAMQVIAVGVVGGTEFVFCRRYACPLALSEEAFLRSENQRGYATSDYAHVRLDDRGFPLTLRPLGAHTMWPFKDFTRGFCGVATQLPTEQSVCCAGLQAGAKQQLFGE